MRSFRTPFLRPCSADYLTARHSRNPTELAVRRSPAGGASVAVQVGPECGGTVVAQLVTQSAFESRADLAVATDGQEVHSCKRPGCAEVEYLPAGSFDPSVRVRRDGVDESVGALRVRVGRAQPASNTGRGQAL